MNDFRRNASPFPQGRESDIIKRLQRRPVLRALEIFGLRIRVYEPVRIRYNCPVDVHIGL